MSGLSRATLLVVFTLSVFAPRDALAWESVCRQYADPTQSPAQYASQSSAPSCSPSAGPNTARQRWVGPLDEHRALWERTRELAGLPASVSSTVLLRIFASSAAAPGSSAPSLLPVPFQSAERVHTRAFTVGELAQLPDFSYALWDWASGHELCPLEGTAADPVLCHDFASHMGPVNSNHFVPQAGAFYARYHALAVARGQECASLKTSLAAAGGRFDDFARACELEALAIEAVGQHFLHDAWSMGHMWQRWGSPDLVDFSGATADEKRDRAVLVALVSGLIHGARGVLQALPGWTSYDVNDALCAPWDDVQYKLPDGTLGRGIGDDYLAQLPAGEAPSNSYGLQASKLYACAVAGLREVYEAAGQSHGPASARAAWLAAVNPTSADCFGQRATNASLLRAAAIHLKVLGQQVTLPLDARFVSWMLPKVARQQGQVAVAPALRNEFRLSLQRVVSVARLRAVADPLGTDAAEGGLGSFLGAAPNGAYLEKAVPATYVDPPLPWPTSPSGGASGQERAQHLARTFHRAHVQEHCAATTSELLAVLKSRASDPGLDATTHAAACEACGELAVRHLRVGAPGAYDTSAEPVCHSLGSATYVYQPASGGMDAAALARAWCGC